MRKKRLPKKNPKVRLSPPPKLSDVLQGMLQAADGKLFTINNLLQQTSGRGAFLIVILITLPFLVPMPPGLSTPLGLAIVYLGVWEIIGKKGSLPAWLGDRVIPADKFPSVIRGTIKLLKFIEKAVKPRFSWWLMLPGMMTFHWILIAFLGLLLALPIPLPASNLVPGYALVFVTVSALERDGKMMLLGYVLSLASIVWISAFVFLGDKLFEYLLEWFKN